MSILAEGMGTANLTPVEEQPWSIEIWFSLGSEVNDVWSLSMAQMERLYLAAVRNGVKPVKFGRGEKYGVILSKDGISYDLDRILDSILGGDA